MLITVASGTVTEHDLLDHLESHVEDPEIRPGMKEIVDLSEVTLLELPADSIRRLIDFELAHPEPFHEARMAIVAPHDLPYGLSRMYQILSDEAGAEVGVFRDRPEAERWLRDE